MVCLSRHGLLLTSRASAQRMAKPKGEEDRMRTNGGCTRGSRRTFLQMSAVASATVAFRILTEPALARAQRKEKVLHPGAVVIDANENPLGPCKVACSAINDIAPQGGRYSDWLTRD